MTPSNELQLGKNTTFPLYKVFINGQEHWFDRQEATWLLSLGSTVVALGVLALDSSEEIRPITMEEYSKITNISPEASPAK
jgi:hypothetical protein